MFPPWCHGGGVAISIHAAKGGLYNSQHIFENLDDFPNSIITDQGLEFYNSSVQKVFQTYGIHHYSTKTKTKWKAAMAERVIRTLKSRMEKYFYEHKTKRWIDFLPKVVNNYNHSPHRTIGMAPYQVTEENSAAIYKKVFGDTSVRVIPRLGVGDRVRIILDKNIFEKGYTANWSEKIYKITQVLQKLGVVWYKLEDLNKVKLPGIRYYWQLNLVSKHVG